MNNRRLLSVLLAVALTVTTDSALGQNPANANLTPQQAQFWSANHHLAQFVEGRGYRVPGAVGFFDKFGRPITKNAGVVVGSLANEDEDDDEGIPIDGNFGTNLKNRILGRETVTANRAITASQPAAQPVAQPPLIAVQPTPEQAQWWAKNFHLARQIPGPGYPVFQIEGIPHKFNAQGHQLVSESAASQPQVPQPPAGQPPITQPFVPPNISNNYGGTPPTTPLPNRGRYSQDNPYGTTPSKGPRRALEPTAEEDESWLDALSVEGVTKTFTGERKVNQQAARTFFSQAEAAFRKKDYDTAREQYEQAANNWPQSPLEEDAMFMLAECDFFSDEYPDAFTAYEELLKKYKRSQHLEKVVARQFSIGQFWLQLEKDKPKWKFSPNVTDKTRPWVDTVGYARRAFEKVRINDPTGKLADDSLLASAHSYFTHGDWDQAAYHYMLLIREYPNSEHLYLAHQLGIQSKLRVYQGPEYDITPLKDAKKLTEQALKQFPRQTPENRKLMLAARARIAAEYASRDFLHAEFYDKQDFAGGARQYYQRVAEDYPNTPLAQQSRERLAQLQSEPNVPPQRFTWISGLFPKEKSDISKIIDERNNNQQLPNNSQGTMIARPPQAPNGMIRR